MEDHDTASITDFMRSLPVDGSLVEVPGLSLDLAFSLHQAKLCHLSRGLWPYMVARLTFEGRKWLSRNT